MSLTQPPVARVQMLIRRPADPVWWRFEARGADATLITITASEFQGDAARGASQAHDNMGGFSYVLAACKAWLEHGIALDLVADHTGTAPARAPRAPVILQPGEGRDWPMGRSRALFKADGDETRHRYAISEWWLEHPPGAPAAQDRST